MPPTPDGQTRARPRAAIVLIALVAGIAIGALGARYVAALTASAAPIIEVVGTVWINAIRMTVIPLVVALTVASVAAQADPARIGRLGALAIPVFVILLVAGGVFTMLIAPVSLERLEIPADAASSMRASVSTAETAKTVVPTLAQRLVEIVPTNPVKSAADGAILPLVVFSLLLGLALARVGGASRDRVVGLCRATSDALLVLVQWILAAAPVGVFALALALGARMGASSASALVQYVVTMSVILFAFTLLLYPVAIILGRVSPRKFFTAALPAQAVAFSSRSSLASLPAMIAGARDVLAVPPRMSGFVLPLAVSVFRLNVPIAWVIGVIFLGKIYGVPVTTATLATVIVTSTLLSFSVPGIPSGSLFIMAPVLAEHGLPPEGVGILIALDAIPDMFKRGGSAFLYRKTGGG